MKIIRRTPEDKWNLKMASLFDTSEITERDIIRFELWEQSVELAMLREWHMLGIYLNKNNSQLTYNFYKEVKESYWTKWK